MKQRAKKRSKKTLATDRRLMLAYLAGEEGAFEALYSRFKKVVWCTVNKYASRDFASEVDDICQLVWMKIVKSGHTYNKDRPLRNWLCVIAVREVFTYQTQQCPKTTIGMADRERVNGPGIIGKEFADTRLSPLDQVINSESTEILRNGVNRLPAKYRSILQKVVFQGESLVNYAAANGINVNTTHGRVDRAIKHLSKNSVIQELGAA